MTHDCRWLVLLLIVALVGCAQSKPLTNQVDEIAQELSVVADRVSYVAVTEPTTVEGEPSALGRSIAELLVIALLENGVTVVERRQMDEALDELNFNLSDLVDPDNQRRFGKLLGADALIIGSIVERRSSADVYLRVIQTETGVILAGTRQTVKKPPPRWQRIALGGLIAGAVGGAIWYVVPRPTPVVFPTSRPPKPPDD